jgi:hypothetical protein
MRLPSSPVRLAALLAAAGAVALYLPFLSVPFEYDDKVEILRNPVIRHPGNVAEMVRYNPFRVLLLYTFAWDLWAWGFRPEGYRALNIAIHAFNAGLVACLLDRFGRRVGPDAPERGDTHGLFVLAGTLFFALHPLAIESVTYVSGRSSSLSATFVLLALVLYADGVSRSADPEVADWLRARTARWGLGLAALLAAGGVAALAGVLAGSLGVVVPGRRVAIGLAAGSVAAVAALYALSSRFPAAASAGAFEPQELRARAVAASRRYTASFVAFVLGCLTKEIAVMLPAVLFLAEATVWRGSVRAALRTAATGRLLPFFGIPAFFVALRVAAYGYVATPQPVRPLATQLLTQAEVVPRYLGLWVVPWPQSIYHDHPAIPSPGRLWSWLGAFAVALLIAAGFALMRRKPLISFGILTTFVTLLPTSSVFALKETMVEHRLYLPTLGVSFVAGALLAGPGLRVLGRSGAIAALGAACAGLATAHVSYDLLWRSEEQLWTHAVRLNPVSADAWRNLGDFYLDQGRLPDAERALGEALRARPGDATNRTKLGVVLARAGRGVEAREQWKAALDAVPCHAPALNNLANLELQEGEVQRAVDLYDRSIRCNPDNVLAHLGLGHIYYERLHDPKGAARHYGRALELMDPYSPDAPLLKKRLLELTW